MLDFNSDEYVMARRVFRWPLRHWLQTWFAYVVGGAVISAGLWLAEQQLIGSRHSWMLLLYLWTAGNGLTFLVGYAAVATLGVSLVAVVPALACDTPRAVHYLKLHAVGLVLGLALVTGLIVVVLEYGIFFADPSTLKLAGVTVLEIVASMTTAVIGFGLCGVLAAIARLRFDKGPSYAISLGIMIAVFGCMALMGKLLPGLPRSGQNLTALVVVLGLLIVSITILVRMRVGTSELFGEK